MSYTQELAHFLEFWDLGNPLDFFIGSLKSYMSCLTCLSCNSAHSDSDSIKIKKPSS